MYTTIFDPVSKLKFKTKSILGKQLINNYIKVLCGGSSTNILSNEVCKRCSQDYTDEFSSALDGCKICGQTLNDMYWCKSCDFFWCTDEELCRKNIKTFSEVKWEDAVINGPDKDSIKFWQRKYKQKYPESFEDSYDEDEEDSDNEYDISFQATYNDPSESIDSEHRDIGSVESDLSLNIYQKLEFILNPVVKENNIILIGDTNHTIYQQYYKYIKSFIIKNNGMLFYENAEKTTYSRNLDCGDHGFRTDILIAFIVETIFDNYGNELIPLDLKIQKISNVWINILTSDKKLPHSLNDLNPIVSMYNDHRCKESRKIDIITELCKTKHLNYKDIYDYYFIEDLAIIKSDMKALFSADLYELTPLFIPQLSDALPINEHIQLHFYNITQKYREISMLKNLRNYIDENPDKLVIIITGKKHIPELSSKLSKLYKIYLVNDFKTIL